jgi:hypothetical protein
VTAGGLPAAGLGVLLAVVAAASTGAQTPTTPAGPAAPVATRHAVNLTAKLKIKRVGGAFVGTGPVSGPPFGRGGLTSRSTVRSRSPLRTATTLTARYATGSVTLQGSGHYSGSTFLATMAVTSGTGAYRGIRGSGLKVSDVSRRGVDTLRVSGGVVYADPAAPAPAGY